ncbi:dihydropyrimidinase [Methylobacterium oryzihabitans]|uniref:Dihydropyrimidinase n=1 Tax=Methylobacterium oryzihabitans TaxID=2499852 RepID=A0A437NV69_9HYPH|nr:dihydropyrimidinase [Methylobacterium oryzihabitans]RVU13912.1 dihydropyrimidinase [Methylobacterium oryzihabitans]
MTDPAFDTVIRGGTVATATDVFRADLGIAGGKVAALGLDLPPGRREIDATGRLVLPGGVDSHAHIEQLSANGLMNADTWESATRSAALGGTTSVIAFAAQHVGMDLAQVVADYQGLAERGSLIDYAFHLIIADATEKAVREDIPALVRAGHTSLKAFMTYDRLQLGDEALLEVMAAAKEAGALVCVHAENHGLIAFASRRLLAEGRTTPKYHAASHPRLSESEAFERVVRFSQYLDQPVMVFHVSTREGAAILRRARGEGIPILAETCPQYLFLTEADLDRPGLEGAKWMCSPPLREAGDQEALWRALDLGDLQTVSSDHAPYRYDETGKLKAGPGATFKQIANGMPGLQMRLPLLFDAMVSGGRLGLRKFVELTATAPARIYGLAGKGSVAVGADADLCLWDPERRVTLADAMVADRTGFTPYAGRTVTGWPETVLRRGEVIVAEGEVRATPGTGRRIARG